VPTAIRLPDATCTIRAIDPLRLAQLEDRLAAEAARLPGLAARLMQDATAARFASAREQVPAYGAWAYGWVQSYVTSFRVLGRLGMGLAAAVTAPEDTPLLERLATEIAEPMREAFRRHVMAATEADGGLPADLAYAGAVLDEAWRSVLDQAAAALVDGAPVVGAPAAQSLDFNAARVSLAQPLGMFAPVDPLAASASDGTDPPAIFLRSMRPMASRFGAVAVRASEAGSILAAGGAFGYAMGGVPGVVVGFAGGVGLSWGLDWLISRVDASLNRMEFEAQALAAIAAAETQIVRQAEAVVEAALVARRMALQQGAAGCG
jgi:hypothetical protein